MPRINIKEIKERVTQMNNGWTEGAPTDEFNGVSQTEFAADIVEATAAEQEWADVKAQEAIKKAKVETLYSKLNAKSVKVANGVRGHENHGTDSPLYGAMGFIRDSERDSGLTRKTRKTEDE